MEKPKPFESSIHRTTPEIPIGMNINGERKAALLRYDNTLVVTHEEEFEHFDYVLLYDESVAGEPIYMFRDGDDFGLGERLIDQGFDVYARTYPSIDDEERWWKYQLRDIDSPPSN